jgi:hypothetical protein
MVSSPWFFAARMAGHLSFRNLNGVPKPLNFLIAAVIQSLKVPQLKF